MQVYTCIFGGTKYTKKKLAKYTQIIYVETGKTERKREQYRSKFTHGRKELLESSPSRERKRERERERARERERVRELR
jgi:hypothetical protein